MIHILSYTYDAINRVTERVTAGNTDTFAYNRRSELTSTSLASGVYTYNYDAIGNNLQTSLNSVPTTYTPNSLNQYMQVGPRTFTYDPDGNLLNDGLSTYAYDAENRLISATSNPQIPNSPNLQISFAYDHQSRRVLKTTPTATHTYLYDNWNLLLETVRHSNNTVDEFEYFWGKDLSGTFQGAGGVGGLLAVRINSACYFPFYDHNGNITDYVDANGNLVAHYEYDAFGNTLTQSGTLAHLFRHRFSTKYYDEETGFYYYGKRFYSPVLRRWLNRDPIQENGGINLYAFCVNNPVNKWDYLGLSVKIISRDRKGREIEVNKVDDILVFKNSLQPADPTEKNTFDYGTTQTEIKKGLISNQITCIKILVAIYINDYRVPLVRPPETITAYRKHLVDKNRATIANTVQGMDLAHEKGHATGFMKQADDIKNALKPLIGKRALSVNTLRSEVKKEYEKITESPKFIKILADEANEATILFMSKQNVETITPSEEMMQDLNRIFEKEPPGGSPEHIWRWK